MTKSAENRLGGLIALTAGLVFTTCNGLLISKGQVITVFWVVPIVLLGPVMCVVGLVMLVTGKSGEEDTASEVNAPERSEAWTVPGAPSDAIGDNAPSGRLLDRYSNGERDFEGTNWVGENFAGANLENACFRGAKLDRVNLSGANLKGADFRMASLIEADLSDADLTGALMVRTDLYRANLSGAILMPRWLDESFLCGADLSRANIAASFEDVVVGMGTKFHGTTLAFADFSKVKFASQDPDIVEKARAAGVTPRQLGGCDVDVTTLGLTAKMIRADLGEANRLKGDPEHLAIFFRDAGVEEDLLGAFFESKLSEPARVSTPKYDVFVSFKNSDHRGEVAPEFPMAQELYDFLVAKGLHVFMSNATLAEVGTARFKEAIDEALDGAQILVVVAASPESLRAPWVSYEWNSFFNDILGNLKPNGEVLTYTDGVHPTELPRSLRQVQMLRRGAQGREELYRYVRSILSRT